MYLTVEITKYYFVVWKSNWYVDLVIGKLAWVFPIIVD